jgi:hypothetical protein
LRTNFLIESPSQINFQKSRDTVAAIYDDDDDDDDDDDVYLE